MILLLITLSTDFYFNFFILNTNLVVMNKNILLYIWLFVTAKLLDICLKSKPLKIYTTLIKYYIIKLDIDY